MTDDDILADWTRRDECLHGANSVIWFARCIERKAAAAERDRCAKLCEAEHVLESIDADVGHPCDISYNMALKHAAATIRSGVDP